MMTYAIILEGSVVGIEDHEIPIAGGLSLVQIPEDLEVTTEWTYDGANFIPPVEPTLSLDEVKNIAREAAKQQAEAKIEKPVSKYPMNERLSWSEQKNLADAQIAGTATDAQTAILLSMATIRGFSDARAMAARIIEKANQFTALATMVASHKNKALDAITAATTEADVTAAQAAFEIAINAPAEPTEGGTS